MENCGPVIDVDGRAVDPGVSIDKKEAGAIDGGDLQSQHPSLTSDIFRNHQGSLASHAYDPPSLSYLPSNYRCNPYMTTDVASDVPHDVRQPEDPKLNRMTWPKDVCGAISSASSSSSSNSPESSMAYGFAGPFSPSPSNIEARGGGSQRLALPGPFPSQRTETSRILANQNGYGNWVPPGSSYWHGERDTVCGRSPFASSV